MTSKAEWVIWNGSMGMLDMVSIGRVEAGETGRRAYLAEPYDIVGPFCLTELETTGRIAFGACLVMSRERWRIDQDRLRRAAWERRRALQSPPDADDQTAHRAALELPLSGKLEPSQIVASFRRLAKRAHPDAGGASQDFRRISDAREALLRRWAKAV